ncbi:MULTISPECIES: Hsp20/alpha crystallin family protein [unclassified Streptomyces]|nr:MULTISPECIES: Hsp20/alpha crystallin family protein [unclassified Streptomyces]
MALPVRRGGPLAERRFPGWGTDPLAEFNDLIGRMGTLLESTMGGAMGSMTEGMAAWSPLADLSETDDAYLVEVEVPGVKREDLDIEMTERELTITGEFKERERTGMLRRSTRRRGRFEYRAALPGDISPENVEATLDNGVLTVKVPKAEATKSRRIEITSGH